MVNRRRSNRLNSIVPLKNKASPETLSSKFMSFVPDDLLQEILLRLPHARDAIRCGTVSKLWHSLINHDHFKRGFIQMDFDKRSSDSSSYSLPYTLLLYDSQTNCYEPFYQIFSAKSRLLHGLGKPASSSPLFIGTGNYLDFFPCDIKNQPLHTWSSSEDLLLLMSRDNIHAYYICNPVTKQWLALPEAPKQYVHDGCSALVFERAKNMSCNKQKLDINAQFRFKVVRINRFYESENCYVVAAQIFCSETGKWSESIFSFPLTIENRCLSLPMRSVASNGTLYWLLRERSSEQSQIKGILAINLFNNGTTTISDPKHCRFIHLPDGFRHINRLCLGVVKERLRLSQLLKDKVGFVLRIWELNSNNNNDASEEESWILVHDVSFKMTALNREMSVLSFHPNNGNVIFALCRHNHVYEYTIGEDKYESFGKFKSPVGCKLPKRVYSHVGAFTLVHPSWPTPVPTLPTV